MELLETIKTRGSVREFTGQRTPDEHIEMVLDARGMPRNLNTAKHNRKSWVHFQNTSE